VGARCTRPGRSPAASSAASTPRPARSLRAEFATILYDAKWAWARYGEIVDAHPAEVASFGEFPSYFLGIVSPDGTWEHHEGLLRFIDANGQALRRGLPRPRATRSSSARSPTPTPT
jgi:NAD-reducing hydrogenase large subunit